MFHYPQSEPNFFHPISPHNLAPKTVKPTISFCPAFSKGHCQFGNSCGLNHIDVSGILCKYDQKGICKFGPRCIFKHETNPHVETSELSPLIQSIVQENSLFSQRLSQAEDKISALEQELAALRNLVRASPSTKPNTDVKTTRNTHSTMKNAKAHDQPPVLEPSNSAPSTFAPMSTPKPSKLMTRPPVLKSRLPWIKSVKRATQKLPKLKREIKFNCSEELLDVSIQHHREKSPPSTFRPTPPTFPIICSPDNFQLSKTDLHEETIRMLLEMNEWIYRQKTTLYPEHTLSTDSCLSKSPLPTDSDSD